MEDQGQEGNASQISKGNPGGDDLPHHQIHAPQQQGQGGDFANGAGDVSQQHVRKAPFRQGGHDHVVQGGGRGNAVHGVTGQGCRKQEHHECPGRQGGVKDVLSQAAAQAFDQYDGKDAA